MPNGPYVLITPARNEAALIEKTLQSVISQTVPPERWVVVDDGSSDRTEDIVKRYARQFGFIQLLKLDRSHSERNFSSQVYAIRAGFNLIQNRQYGWIGNLDADISLPPDYYERMIGRFQRNAKLGLAGGFIYEKVDGAFRSRRYNHVNSIPHAIQFFRRECYEAIGGYLPLKYGGPDWCAEVMARMKGWETQAFPDVRVYHHRPTGSVEGMLHAKFRMGLMDYSLGSHPVFEIIKCLYRLPDKPCILSSLFRIAGFFWLYCLQEERCVPREFVRYLRNEQIERLRTMIQHRNGSSGDPSVSRSVKPSPARNNLPR